MTVRFEAPGVWPGVLERLLRRDSLAGDEPAAALLGSRCEKVTVVLEQPPAT